MLTHLKLNGFTALPYLAASALMTNHPEGLSFSTDKPNIVVGPNGSGKSALMTTLAYLTLSYIAGYSSLDGGYLGTHDRQFKLWGEMPDGDSSWRTVKAYLSGLVTDYDGGRALYFKSGHIPGNESFIAAAIMQGYGADARAYAELTDDKSSGQQNQAVQARILAVLAGSATVPDLGFHNWHAPRTLEELAYQEERARGTRFGCSYEKEGKLLRQYLGAAGGAMVLMDEPEQSLDALAEARLWQSIAATVPSVQVIVATHSIYPLLHPERFNIIEAVPGYVDQVKQYLA